MSTARRAYIYALEAGFSQVTKNCQVFCQTVGGVFLTFLPKIRDGNSICQTAGDALTTDKKKPLRPPPHSTAQFSLPSTRSPWLTPHIVAPPKHMSAMGEVALSYRRVSRQQAAPKLL